MLGYLVFGIGFLVVGGFGFLSEKTLDARLIDARIAGLFLLIYQLKPSA